MAKSISLAKVKQTLRGFGFKLVENSKEATKEKPIIYQMEDKEVRVFKGQTQGRYKICLYRDGTCFKVGQNHMGLADAQHFAEEVDPTIKLDELVNELTTMQKRILEITKSLKKNGIKV